MDTILISKVVPRDGKKPWKVLDGNAVEYVTWDDALGAQAELLLNEQAVIEADVTQKPGRAPGTFFTDRKLTAIAKLDKSEPTPANEPDWEPSVNTGKQVVIIRQNTWSQANAIYEKAVELYCHVYPEKDMALDMEAVHAIAWQLFSSEKKLELFNMQVLAHLIEMQVRADWFPMTDREIPF